MVLYCSAVNTNLYQPRADTNVQSHNEHHGTHNCTPGKFRHSLPLMVVLVSAPESGMHWDNLKDSKSKKPAAHKNAAHGINTPRQQRRYVLLQCVLDFEPLQKINENYEMRPYGSMSRRDAKVVGYQIPTFVLECLMVHYSGTASPSTAVQSQHERTEQQVKTYTSCSLLTGGASEVDHQRWIIFTSESLVVSLWVCFCFKPGPSLLHH